MTLTFNMRKISFQSIAVAALISALGLAATAQGQATSTSTPQQSSPAAKAPSAAPNAAQNPQRTPLELNSLDPSGRPDPFPPANPRFFTATSPTVDTVNAFLKARWGYDANRIWRVEAIQKTAAPGISKVVIYVAEKSANSKVQPMAFFVTPDGQHVIAGDGVATFGATPFAETRKLLQDNADGAHRGASSKDFMLIEFADLQCPHCKEAQTTMDQLAKDFPNARIVYQSFPLPEVHPFAFKAAAYGVCIAKKNNDAFFPYAAAVYETQAALTPETGDATLKAAVSKAGMDPVAIDACAQTQATKDDVNASVKLGEQAGVDQTPMIAVNGNVLPLTGIPYETLKSIVAYQAASDGVSTSTAAAASPSTSAPSK